MPEVSVILPCRDEEDTIGRCIGQIREVFRKYDIKGEIIVSDSSKDKSPEIAKRLKAKLVKHDKKGYGIACIEGIKVAKGKYLVIGDADCTYDFSEIPSFIEKLKEGYDLVIGSRMNGDIRKGAMPFHHRYIGNPFLSWVLNRYSKTKVSDAHSGFRALTKKSVKKLDLKTSGMEFASEMIIKAAKKGLKMAEIPISYDRREGRSKLRSFSDGWRHLRFIMLFSPGYLFFIPGSILMLAGLIAMISMIFGSLNASGKDISIYISFAGSLLSIIGIQTLSLGAFSKINSVQSGFDEHDSFIDFLAKNFPLEKGVMISILLILIAASVIAKNISINGSFIPGIIFGSTFLIIGIQAFFSVLFISMMVIEKAD